MTGLGPGAEANVTTLGVGAGSVADCTRADLPGASDVVDEVRWTAKDVIVHALGVGAGRTDEPADLALVSPGAGVPPVVAPSFPLITGASAQPWRLLQVDPLAPVLVAGHEVSLAGALPADGAVTRRARVVGIRGIRSGTAVCVDTASTHVDDGRAAFTVRTQVVLLGQTWRSGARGVFTQRPEHTIPSRPIFSSTEHIRPEQARLFGVLGGEDPIHFDPAAAQAAGFAGPILHGACTVGIAIRAMLRAMDLPPDAVNRYGVRYLRPVRPGTHVRTETWTPADGTVAFRVLAEDGAVVLLGQAGTSAAATPTAPASATSSLCEGIG